jgi:hypothetical protein
MKTEVHKEIFTKSNMLNLKYDVESVFSVDCNFGLQGQLLKLSRTQNLSTTENLSILLGRLACIGEEWNYQIFNKEQWENIFNPRTTKTENILKVFHKSTVEKFMKEFSEFQSYFLNKKYKQVTTSINIIPNFRGQFKFDGSNIDKFYKVANSKNNPGSLKLDKFNIDEIELILCNVDSWYWNLWYIETKNDNYLFERIIIS